MNAVGFNLSTADQARPERTWRGAWGLVCGQVIWVTVAEATFHGEPTTLGFPALFSFAHFRKSICGETGTSKWVTLRRGQKVIAHSDNSLGPSLILAQV